MIKSLLRLLRPRHYIKNFLVLAPLVFGKQLFSLGNVKPLVVAIITFSLTASAIYIINDIRDVKKDRQHPTKKFRPIASNKVSVKQATILVIFLAILIITIGYAGRISMIAWMLLGAYAAINIAYSYGLKNVPILDVALLASGFVIRVLYGASIFHIRVSHWLYMTVLAGAFYVSFGKRRNEIIINGTKSRRVNELYSLQFLDKNMYVCMALTLVFYALWATDPARADVLMYATIPSVILLLMTYSLKIEENNSSGDPVDVIAKSNALQVLVPFVAVLMVFAVYLK